MIHVDRSRVTAPADLTERGARALLTLDFDYRRTRFRQHDPTFDQDIYASQQVRTALLRVFGRKCAFCEQALKTLGAENVEHFRPRIRASGRDQSVSVVHYFWLAYEWSNLYTICYECKSYKGSAFPVRGRRAAIGTRGAQLAKEHALLVDPCVDEPAEHLRVMPNGLLEPLSDRGEATIQLFRLNRSALLAARHAHKTRFLGQLTGLQRENIGRKSRASTLIMRLRTRLQAPTTEFTAVSREFFKKKTPALPRRPEDPAAVRAEASATPPAGVLGGRTEVVSRLARVEIENYRAIQHIEFSFPTLDGAWVNQRFGRDSQEPWVVLLGNNGIGKSSILRAITLALAPPAQRQRLCAAPSQLVTRGRGQRSGRVRLWFTDSDRPYEWAFGSASRSRVVRPPPSMPVLGYGSTRLLPRSADRKGPVRPSLFRAGNLFSAVQPLADAERWLTSRQVSRTAFDLLATDLKLLLAMDAREFLSRTRGRLIARLFRKELPVRELSDGFQSVLALALDVMFNLSARSADMRSVEALILIDEIEVHLHPTWKIRIVETLRTVFPRARFIVTTHDPLCVQGLASGELHVLTRHEKTRAVAIRQIDLPLGLRADQVLTGEWFGMGSTRDPDTMALMGRYQQLLLEPHDEKNLVSRTDIENTLRARLGRFGDSPLERAGMLAYAQVTARASTPVSPEQAQLRLRSRILELLPAVS